MKLSFGNSAKKNIIALFFNTTKFLKRAHLNREKKSIISTYPKKEKKNQKYQ